MPGLDKKIIDEINPANVIAHVKADVRSDFILAPHYNAVFTKSSDDLWEQLKRQLSAGTYQPDLPITMSVPKERFFTRPGSILTPADRFLYQALVDLVSNNLEANLDRTRAFSHVPSDDQDKVFVANHECWANFQKCVSNICNGSPYLLKADISHYFERLPQHHLINLMSNAKCPAGVVRLLEEVLSAFRERNSFGIIQGIFPSDVLGNFFLSDFDAYCELMSIASARYVDDIYMGFSSEAAARQGLGYLIEVLRKDGLHLNEGKSHIIRSQDVISEETAIDRLFDEIRKEVKDGRAYERMNPYGFSVDWDDFDQDEPDDDDDEELENAAVERLMDSIGDYPKYEDQIEKFCLPILRTAASDHAVDYVLTKLREKPHQTRLYFSYLSAFVRTNKYVVREIEKLTQNDSDISDYQRMFLLAAALKAEMIDRQTVNTALNWLQNAGVAQEARAIAAVFAAAHGVATQKRAVRTWYESEPSNYVRSAILYSSRHMTGEERATCKRAWGGHSAINTLVSKAI